MPTYLQSDGRQLDRHITVTTQAAAAQQLQRLPEEQFPRRLLL